MTAVNVSRYKRAKVVKCPEQEACYLHAATNKTPTFEKEADASLKRPKRSSSRVKREANLDCQLEDV